MDQMKTGKFIAALRKEKGMTQKKLGEKLGVTNKLCPFFGKKQRTVDRSTGVKWLSATAENDKI